MKESASVWDNWERGSWQALATEVAKLERVARAVKNVPEYVEADCVCGVEEEHKHCPYCGYKEPDGHWKDCKVLELRAALADLPEDALGG